MSLSKSLIEKGWLKTDRIINAFDNIERQDFLPEKIRDLSVLNEALPIGYNQTISQPSVVAFMLELLQPKKGDKVLDIGYGSCWTTALLAHIVGEKGRVIGMEIIPEIAKFGKNNLLKYSYIKEGRVKLICRNASKGYPEEAKFDRILVSASIESPAPSWKKQLQINGRMVVPIKNSICLFEKKSETKFYREDYPGFIFVPFVRKYKSYNKNNQRKIKKIIKI